MPVQLSEEVTSRMARKKFERRQALQRIEDYDWHQAQLDLQLLKTVHHLTQAISSLVGNSPKTPSACSEFDLSIGDANAVISKLLANDGCDWTDEASEALRFAKAQLEAIKHDRDESESSSRGGATAEPDAKESTRLRAGSACANRRETEVPKTGAILMNKVLANIVGRVGRIELTPDQQVKLVQEDWSLLLDELEQSIQDGTEFIDAEFVARPVTPDKKGMGLLFDALAIASDGALSTEAVKPNGKRMCEPLADGNGDQ